MEPITLCDREQQVLEYAAEGYTSTETAWRIGISSHTEKEYRRRVMKKLDAYNLVNAVHNAHKLGLLK